MFAALTATMSIIVTLLAMEAILRFLPVRTVVPSERVDANHPIVHFVPNQHFVFSEGWNLQNVSHGRTNNVGFVNPVDYDSTLHSPLLAVIGDSFVEALMVPDTETVQARLARAAKGDARVYSFGISDAPLSHYLAEAAYAHRTFHPNAYVIVVVANDFDESLLKYKNIAGQYYYRDSSGVLALTRIDYDPQSGRAVFRRLIRHSALVRYLYYDLGVGALLRRSQSPAAHSGLRFVGNTSAVADSARVADSKRAVDAVLRDLPARAGIAPSQVVFAVDADRAGIYNPSERAAAQGSYFLIMRQYFIDAARAHDFGVIDLEPVFEADWNRAHQRFDFPTDAHWSGHGHAVVAKALLTDSLIQRVLGITPSTSRLASRIPSSHPSP